MTFPIVFLWAVPRSVSTAFEKMVANRGDFTVFGEPFIKCYKMHCAGQHDAALAGYETTLDALAEAAEAGPVFVKEMAYHVKPIYEHRFFGGGIHSFLVRHPKYVLPSLFKMRADFTYEETGFEQSCLFFEVLKRKTGKAPLVINGQALRETPRQVVADYFTRLGFAPCLEALTWEYGSRPEWHAREPWHALATQSRGFLRQNRTSFELLDEPRVREAYRKCLPHYRRLDRLSLRCGDGNVAVEARGA